MTAINRLRSLTMRVFAAVVLLATLSGCAVSREKQVARKAEKVAASLKSEQSRVLAAPPEESDRRWRLDHLTNLRLTLSAANIARGSVPYAVEEDKRPLAWDVLAEVYDTIEWNIPLGPQEQAKPMPARFQGGALNLAPGVR